VVKKYYLTYAIRATDLDKVAQRIAKLLVMKVVPRNSSYVGDYVSCEGVAADRLTITPSNRKHFPLEMEYKLYSLILFAQNTTGKNVDKELRHSQLKEKLTKLPELLLLEETVEESKN
jgi:isopropylmalate/homocitrate/citramalate synthase